MVAVKSTMQALTSAAPDFNLVNTNNANSFVSRASLAEKPLLIMFICNHCPFVIHIIERLVELANNAQEKGFAVVAINSNDVEKYPQDGPDAMRGFAKETGMKFAYCFDESQSVAKAYGAACTPDFYIYNSNHHLQYRGQMDGSRPSNAVAVSGNDLQNAIDAILNDTNINQNQTPSIGCNIKWKAGNEPEYF
jgi:thiol-disulfide isomerase/thioredoxin